MPKCINLLPCDWLINNLCYQEIEQVYLIKCPMRVYTHTHTYIYTHTHIYIYTHTHTRTHTYIYIYTHTHTHIRKIVLKKMSGKFVLVKRLRSTFRIHTVVCIHIYTQGRCWPNGCPKQDCFVVPPPSNIMEVKKKKKAHCRGKDRTLIKYKNK